MVDCAAGKHLRAANDASAVSAALDDLELVGMLELVGGRKVRAVRHGREVRDDSGKQRRRGDAHSGAGLVVHKQARGGWCVHVRTCSGGLGRIARRERQQCPEQGAGAGAGACRSGCRSSGWQHLREWLHT